MTESSRAFCARCDHEVDVEHRHSRRLRRLLKGYLLIPLLSLPAFPVLASDYVFCIPAMMLYMLGIGPVLVIVRDPPLCCECGALISGEGRAAVHAISQ